MKRIVLFLLILFMVSCASTKNRYKINCVSLVNEGYLKLQLDHPSKLSKNELESVSKDAIHMILYSGYTSKECQTQKPIFAQTNDIENFKKIESNFFSKDGIWTTFIRSEINKNNSNDHIILISKDALLQYLEEQNIIKSLNNGF
jgi:hypothetical protein